MMKTLGAALGGLVLLSGFALAASPPPNDIGSAFMGGGTFYNPDHNDLYGHPDFYAHPATGAREGNTQEGGGIYRAAPQR
jgi:hypothetical protein